MNFIDETVINTRSGKGGDGMVSFMCAKGRPKLGPDGGDGGPGGNVFLVGQQNLNTLSSLRYKQWYKSEEGVRGGSQGKTGRAGKDKEIPVPLGTVAYDNVTGRLLGEVMEVGQKLLIAEGGIKGLGNIRFVKSTHQAPYENRPGGKGQVVQLRLELKLLADVGLAGFPNAGKSTLLSRCSAARPKIADYPFTTLAPNLGVVDSQNWGESIVIADVPGLIEGASDGKGLGHEFLKHLERTNLVAFVIEAPKWEREPLDAYQQLKHELEAYSPKLAAKRSIIILTKTDLISDSDEDVEHLKTTKDSFKKMGLEVIEVSAVLGTGINELKQRLIDLVELEREAEIQLEQQAAHSYGQSISP